MSRTPAEGFIFPRFLLTWGLFPTSGREVILVTLGGVNHLSKLKVACFLSSGEGSECGTEAPWRARGWVRVTAVCQGKGVERGLLSAGEAALLQVEASRRGQGLEPIRPCKPAPTMPGAAARTEDRASAWPRTQLSQANCGSGIGTPFLTPAGEVPASFLNSLNEAKVSSTSGLWVQITQAAAVLVTD